eukprot:SAG11_NODE_19230_length_471_cov_1.110215_1_plen_48_part_10
MKRVFCKSSFAQFIEGYRELTYQQLWPANMEPGLLDVAAQCLARRPRV